MTVAWRAVEHPRLYHPFETLCPVVPRGIAVEGGTSNNLHRGLPEGQRNIEGGLRDYLLSWRCEILTPRRTSVMTSLT